MVTRCNVIKEFGQYELLNVSEDTREQISRIFKQHNHDVKVTGNICMEAFPRRICEHYKDCTIRFSVSKNTQTEEKALYGKLTVLKLLMISDTYMYYHYSISLLLIKYKQLLVPTHVDTITTQRKSVRIVIFIV